MIRALAAASVLVAGTAAADPAPAAAPAAPEPDEAAASAADANLAPVGRHGIVVSGSLLPGTVVGFGSRADSGIGASFSLRLGKVASPSTTMLVELHGGGIVHQPVSDMAGVKLAVATNSLVAATAGALHYVQPSLWLRIGLGWGSYARNEEKVNGVLVANETLSGPAAIVGIGLDLVRWRYATLGLEASSLWVTQRHGLTTMNGLGLGITF